MGATTTATSSTPADAAKAADKPMAPHGIDSGDELGDEDQEPVEELPIRVEPMPQLGAAPADVERALRLIERCRLRGADEVEEVRRILKEGAPAGFITTSGWTPVAAAAFVGNNNILLYLLELGADAMYATARRFAGDNNAGNGGDADAPPSSPLLTRRTSAVGGGNPTSESSPTIQAGAGSNNLNTPLHWASYAGHTDTVALLLQAGYSLEDRDPDGNQSLHLAAAGAHREVLELLLANAAPADTRNRYGNCPEDLATATDCRKLLARFRAQRTCQWCNETFSRIRRPSLCQRCTNVYCDTKPCSSTTNVQMASIASAMTNSSNASGLGLVPKRSLRFCQECATDMRKAEQDLRSVLETKQGLIRQVLDLLVDNGRPSSSKASPVEPSPSDEAVVESGESANEGSHEAPSSESGDGSLQEAEHATADVNGNDGEIEGEQHEPQPTPLGSSRAPLLPTDAAVLRALTLTQTDAEALYTALETAHAKAAAALDAALLEDARRTYHKLVAHVALQEEIKGLMLVRPIGARSLLTPLKLTLQAATKEQVSPEMLELARRVVRGAEAECTLFGAHTLCESIQVGGKAHARDIARLDASLVAARALGASEQLLTQATALLGRLRAEVGLEACLVDFKVVGGPVLGSEAPPTEPAKYVFPDGTTLDSLLQALELRSQLVTAAVDAGSAVEGVSATLLEEGANVLKQLKKDIREETKNEEERRRLEEEAALKAAKKGKKKKA